MTWIRNRFVPLEVGCQRHETHPAHPILSLLTSVFLFSSKNGHWSWPLEGTHWPLQCISSSSLTFEDQLGERQCKHILANSTVWSGPQSLHTVLSTHTHPLHFPATMCFFHTRCMHIAPTLRFEFVRILRSSPTFDVLPSCYSRSTNCFTFFWTHNFDFWV